MNEFEVDSEYKVKFIKGRNERKKSEAETRGRDGGGG